jgi:hypothetical protein
MNRKKFIIGLILWMFSILCFSQDTVILKSLKLRDENLKILYEGVNNILKIGNYDSNYNYFLSSKSVKIINKDSIFVLYPSHRPHYLEVVKSNERGDTTYIDTVKYLSKSIPDFEIDLGGIGSHIEIDEIDELLKLDKIIVHLPYCKFRLSFRIFHSEIMFVKSNKAVNTICGEKGEITNKQKEIIKTLKPGDKIFIYNVRGGIPGGRAILVSPKFIEIIRPL